MSEPTTAPGLVGSTGTAMVREVADDDVEHVVALWASR